MIPASFKLLVVENNPLLSSLLRILLNQPELSLVGHARNATQALGILEKQTADVVIIDISLPDLCGLDAIPLVLQKAPHAKVVLLTDDHNLQYQRAAKKKGAHMCLKKTLIGSDLIPLLRQMIETSDGMQRVSTEQKQVFLNLARTN